MSKKLLMLRNRTLALTEPDRMLEYTIDMDHRHSTISKHVFVVWAKMTRPRMAQDKNIAQVT